MADPRYPSTLTCALRAKYRLDTDLGLVRTEFNNGQFRQRKRYSGEVTTFDMEFAIPFTKLFEWQRWVNRNAFTWFLMNLYSQHSSVSNGDALPHRIRFISDLKGSTITEKYARIAVEAELDPAFEVRLLPDFTGTWIIAGAPPAPATPDDVVAGTVPAPSVNIVIAGIPEYPAA